MSRRIVSQTGNKAFYSEPLLRLFWIPDCLFPKNKRNKQTNNKDNRGFLQVMPSRSTSMSTTRVFMRNGQLQIKNLINMPGIETRS